MAKTGIAMEMWAWEDKIYLLAYSSFVFYFNLIQVSPSAITMTLQCDILLLSLVIKYFAGFSCDKSVCHVRSVSSWTVTAKRRQADSFCQSVTGRSKFVDPIDVNYSLQTFKLFRCPTLIKVTVSL